jgi:hypothetical protein
MTFGTFLAGLIVGCFLCYWWLIGVSWFLKKKQPAPPPKPARDVGDLVLSKTGLPVLLIKKLSHDGFEGCFITPEAAAFGAKINDKPLNALERIILINPQSRSDWPDYPHPLSDEEHRNYAKAMLEDK